ncbi:hypothetical protein V5799_027448 [Amblyomma americanum]|uniref:DDE Tnp4 domain-containing protein n=1 Tax=Amblyomma americanum TaxID=6943 RepID=A0AAQ4DFP6_AMBAM
MKPYGGHNLPLEKRIFNYRLSRARRVAENAFGILSNRFRFLHTTIEAKPDRVSVYVCAACALHNFLGTDVLCGVEASGPVPQETFFPVQLAHGSRPRAAACAVRDALCDYFSAQGAVPWQDDMVHADVSRHRHPLK